MLNRVPNGIAVLVGVKVVGRRVEEAQSVEREAVATGRIGPRARIAAGRLIVFLPRTARGEQRRAGIGCPEPNMLETSLVIE